MSLCVLLLLAACGSAPDTSPKTLAQQFPNRPPAYREGYASGCAFGDAIAQHRQPKETKDTKRIDADSNYANGWYDGYESCKDRENFTPSPSERRNF